MKKSVYKIIVIASLCFFCVISILVGVNIINNRQLAIEQAEDSLAYLSENCADSFRSIFNNSEMLVDNASVVAEQLFSINGCMTDSDIYRQDLEEMNTITEKLVESSKYPISLYITFNPEYFSDEICYAKNLNGEVFNGEELNEEYQAEWLRQWKERTSELGSFYWDTVEAGEMWFELGYDPGMRWEVVSRTKAIYDSEGLLLGIVGADVYAGDISKALAEIDDKTGGFSSLVNERGERIAGSGIGKRQLRGSEYLSAASDIDGRWKITLVQPVNNAVRAVNGITLALIMLGALLLLLIIASIVLVYKKHGAPIIREFEEKDILLINQARQAQMGEMVGNIAHQLKQPLNGINMALSNLEEDYASSLHEDEKKLFVQRIGRMKLRISDMAQTVQDFIGFIKPQKADDVFSVKEQIEKTVDLMRESLQMELIHVEITGDSFLAKGQKNELGQCVFNIMDNAREALGNIDGSRIIRIKLAEGAGGLGQPANRISIWNNGPFLAEDIADRLFELYFTTRESAGGSGIGLYMTKKIIESHFNGTIACYNESDGVCFEIMLQSVGDGESKEELNGLT